MIHPYPLAKTNTNFTLRITLAKSLFAVLIQCSSNKDIPRALPSSQCSAASPLSCVDPPCCAIAQTHFAKAMPWHPQHMKHHYCSALFPTPWFPFFFPSMAALLSLSDKKEMRGLQISVPLKAVEKKGLHTHCLNHLSLPICLHYLIQCADQKCHLSMPTDQKLS